MQLYISKNLVLQLRVHGCQLRAVQPADGNRMVRSCKTEFFKSHDDII